MRVYYEDTDFTGLVYHAQLRPLFRAGAVGLPASGGVGHVDLLEQEEPLAFVVSDLAIKYLKPARIDDALVVRTRCEAIEGAPDHPARRSSATATYCAGRASSPSASIWTGVRAVRQETADRTGDALAVGKQDRLGNNEVVNR